MRAIIGLRTFKVFSEMQIRLDPARFFESHPIPLHSTALIAHGFCTCKFHDFQCGLSPVAFSPKEMLLESNL